MKIASLSRSYPFIWYSYLLSHVFWIKLCFQNFPHFKNCQDINTTSQKSSFNQFPINLVNYQVLKIIYFVSLYCQLKSHFIKLIIINNSSAEKFSVNYNDWDTSTNISTLLYSYTSRNLKKKFLYLHCVINRRGVGSLSIFGILSTADTITR